MRVRSGAAGNARLVGDVDDFPVQRLQVFHTGDLREFIIAHEEFVIPEGLHFQIVVKFRQLDQFFVALLREDGPENSPITQAEP